MDSTSLKINSLMKFNTEIFREECLKIYQDMIDKNIKKANEELYYKINSEIKNNIMKSRGGSDLYNYSSFPKCIPKTECNNRGNGVKCQKCSECCNDPDI